MLVPQVKKSKKGQVVLCFPYFKDVKIPINLPIWSAFECTGLSENLSSFPPRWVSFLTAGIAVLINVTKCQLKII